MSLSRLDCASVYLSVCHEQDCSESSGGVYFSVRFQGKLDLNRDPGIAFLLCIHPQSMSGGGYYVFTTCMSHCSDVCPVSTSAFFRFARISNGF